MARFLFVGDPKHEGDGPNVIDLFGLSFNRLRPTEVADAAVIKKLDTNSHFARQDEPAGPFPDGAPGRTHIMTDPGRSGVITTESNPSPAEIAAAEEARILAELEREETARKAAANTSFE